MGSMLTCFKNHKPIIALIHTKGTDDTDIFLRAKREINIYIENDVDGILIENYFGTYYNIEKVLDYIATSNLGIPYGVNCLNVDAMSFELASRYHCQYLQVDSVVGHVKPRDEATLEAFFKLFRSKCQAYVMGGVRFKYQPIYSKNTIQTDLNTAMLRCDAVCVTEDSTGQETSLEKIKLFRDALNEFPLFVCAGVTADNVYQQLQFTDGAVIGSYFKNNYKDNGDVSSEHVAKLMTAVKRFRQTENCKINVINEDS